MNIEQLQKEFAQALGTSLTNEVGSDNWVLNNAAAKFFAELSETETRLKAELNPVTSTNLLPRHEKIYGIIPYKGQSIEDRRKVLALKLSLVGEKITYQVIYDLMQNLLGIFFVNIVINESSQPNMSSIPGGAVIPGGVILTNDDWRSKLAQVIVHVQKPDGVSDNDFYPVINQIHNFFPYLLPAWCSYHWFMDGSNGPGFFLDQPKNLNHMRFSI